VVAPSPAPPAPARAPPAASPSPALPSSIGAQAAPEPSAAPSQPLPPTPQAAASRVTASLAEPAAPVAPAREVAPGQPQAKGLVTAGRDAPMECLPEGLKTVLNELAAKFGPVSVISTNRLNTDNHSAGSVRHKLHLACKAVDFKIQADMKAVSEFLRRRPEVAGVNSYRHNSVIHIDLNENAAAARAKARPRQAAE
jgi:hypothetical protein